MRSVKALRILFLLSLMLSLFCGEFGELVRLADDTSNDYIQVSASPIHKSGGIASEDLLTRSDFAVAQEFDFHLTLTPAVRPGLSSGSSLLRLLSIQRK
jgi:hypothetical protein